MENKVFTAIVIAFLLLSSLLYPIMAQEETGIYGVVVDDKTGETLPGANVWLDGTAIGSASDDKGEFSLANVGNGEYLLKVSYIGYRDYEQKIKIEQGNRNYIIIKMSYSGAGESEIIVVTAQAKGQMAAINQQLTSNEIKSVVSSDRIQELPDANAAESVGRLPGVSIQREGGEANKVVIRGLSPKYNRIMVDGVQLASTDGGDRSVDMSMISPYSLDGIEVTKAITPDKDGDFIGGMVNFRLRKAESGLHSNIILQGGYSRLKNTYNNYNVVGSVSDRFFDDKLGIFFQANMERRDRSANNMNAWYYLKESNLDIIDPVFTGGVGLTDVVREKERYGATLVMDYNSSFGQFAFKNFFSAGNTKTQFYNEGYDARGRSFSNSTSDNENNLMIYNNVLEYNHQFSSFKVDGKLAHSYSENKTPYNVSFGFNQTSALEQTPDKIRPEDIPQYATRINHDKLYFWDVGDAKDETKGRQLTAMLNLEWLFKISSQINGSIKFGGKYRLVDRFYDFESTGGVMGLASGRQVKDAILKELGKTNDIGSMTLLPFSYFMDKNFEHHEFLNGKYNLGPVVDADIMRRTIEIMRNTDVKTLDTYSYQQMNSITSDYSGTENLSAGYMMVKLKITNQVEFIPGVRYENNITHYTGVRGNSSGAFPQQSYPHKDTTTVRKNGLWLPMIHLIYKPQDWLRIHFAYTNSLSRPDFNIIIPRQDIGRNIVVQNNCNIIPEKSENFDLYFTFHSNYIGLFSVGGFTKTITDKILWTDKRAILNPAQYNLPDYLKNRMIITQYNIDDPVKLRGLELDWQTNFWYLPGFLRGLVFNANYTHIFSEAKYPRTVVESKYEFDENSNLILKQSNLDTTYTDRMIDQPNHIVNLSLGYDYKGFSIRVSMLYQSDVFSGTNFDPEMRIYTDDYLRWDISLKQALPWKGMQVYCNVNNLNEAVDTSLNAGGMYPTSMQHYGRTIDLGLRCVF